MPSKYEDAVTLINERNQIGEWCVRSRNQNPFSMVGGVHQITDDTVEIKLTVRVPSIKSLAAKKEVAQRLPQFMCAQTNQFAEYLDEQYYKRKIELAKKEAMTEARTILHYASREDIKPIPTTDTEKETTT